MCRSFSLATRPPARPAAEVAEHSEIFLGQSVILKFMFLPALNIENTIPRYTVMLPLALRYARDFSVVSIATEKSCQVLAVVYRIALCSTNTSTTLFAIPYNVSVNLTSNAIGRWSTVAQA